MCMSIIRLRNGEHCLPIKIAQFLMDFPPINHAFKNAVCINNKRIPLKHSVQSFNFHNRNGQWVDWFASKAEIRYITKLCDVNKGGKNPEENEKKKSGVTSLPLGSSPGRLRRCKLWRDVCFIFSSFILFLWCLAPEYFVCAFCSGTVRGGIRVGYFRCGRRFFFNIQFCPTLRVYSLNYVVTMEFLMWLVTFRFVE